MLGLSRLTFLALLCSPRSFFRGVFIVVDLYESGKMISLEVLDAEDRYSPSDIFSISTEDLILEKTMMKEVA